MAVEETRAIVEGHLAVQKIHLTIADAGIL